ncbi:hypothetical protein [Rummeliibacillus pycnus]|uniref:hypothetical protein n=1 Tax=Rummeliibacillus pycnus TaxID=101070 RepID=UPI0037C7942C
MPSLKYSKLVLGSLCLIMTAILIGGCKVDFEIKDTDPKEEKLLNSRAMKDERSAKFLSVNPKEDDYLTFISGTKGYKMLFHKDAIVNKFYEIHDKNFERVTVTFRFKNDNLLIYQDTTYYDSTDFGQDVEYLVDSMGKKLKGSKIKHFEDEGKEYYIGRLFEYDEKIPYSYFYAVIHSKKYKTKSVEFYGFGSCAEVKKTCNAEDNRVEKHFNKIIESFEFQ